MYKNHLIVFGVLVGVFLFVGYFFDGGIKEETQRYITQQKLLNEYNELEKRYSKKSVAKEKQKILEFLSLFDIQYSIQKSKSRKIAKETLSMELEKHTFDKVMNYIVNSHIVIYDMKIEKIDQYKVKFDVGI